MDVFYTNVVHQTQQSVAVLIVLSLCDYNPDKVKKKIYKVDVL